MSVCLELDIGEVRGLDSAVEVGSDRPGNGFRYNVGLSPGSPATRHKDKDSNFEGDISHRQLLKLLNIKRFLSTAIKS